MKKVLIIGEGCLDIFQYGKCKRICPEAPVPVFIPTVSKSNGGMALNVKENLKSLGVHTTICTNPSSGIIKRRLIDEVSNQMLVRIDENDNVNELSFETLTKINFGEYDAIVISDYDKGFLSESHIEYIANHHPLTFLDTKKKIYKWASDIKFIKINEKEYNENVSFFVGEYPHNIIVTLGQDGAKYIHINGSNGGMADIEEKHFPIELKDAHPVRDLTGAGDTFLAALVANYLENNDICKAITFANKCAAWVVTQKGVVAIDITKIE